MILQVNEDLEFFCFFFDSAMKHDRRALSQFSPLSSHNNGSGRGGHGMAEHSTLIAHSSIIIGFLTAQWVRIIIFYDEKKRK